MSFTETDMEKCIVRLVKQLVKKDSSFLTVIYGEDVTDTSAQRIESLLNSKFGDKLEITLVNGGQPVYYYILSVE